MRTLASAIAVAFLLLLAEFLTVNPKAAALNDIMGVQPGTIHSMVQKVGCDEADELCEKGKEIVCTKGDSGPDCPCLECNAGGHAVCPNASICAPRGTCKVCGGAWKCCMM
jgi:hypothetical protein